MIKHPLYKSWVFRGAESAQTEYRGRAINPDAYYVGDAQGERIEAGPLDTERDGLREVELMSDTSGT